MFDFCMFTNLKNISLPYENRKVCECTLVLLYRQFIQVKSRSNRDYKNVLDLGYEYLNILKLVSAYGFRSIMLYQIKSTVTSNKCGFILFTWSEYGTRPSLKWKFHVYMGVGTKITQLPWHYFPVGMPQVQRINIVLHFGKDTGLGDGFLQLSLIIGTKL